MLNIAINKVFNNAATDSICILHGSTTNKIFLIYRDEDNNNYGTVRVGTINNENITFGPKTVFNAGYTADISAAYDPVSNKLVIAYVDYDNKESGVVIVGEVKDDQVFFASPVIFNSEDTVYTSIACIPNTNKIIIAYIDYNNDRGVAVIGKISENNITFGSKATFSTSNINYISTAYDPVSGKFIISYSDGDNNYRGATIVGEIKDDGIFFYPPVVFSNSDVGHISVVYDPSSNKLVLAYKDSGNNDYGTAIVGTINDGNIIFGKPVVFSASSTWHISANYDTKTNRVIITYSDYGNNSVGKVITGIVKDDTIIFDSEVTFNSELAYNISSIYDPKSNKNIVAYKDEKDGARGKLALVDIK